MSLAHIHTVLPLKYCFDLLGTRQCSIPQNARSDKELDHIPARQELAGLVNSYVRMYVLTLLVLERSGKSLARIFHD